MNHTLGFFLSCAYLCLRTSQRVIRKIARYDAPGNRGERVPGIAIGAGSTAVSVRRCDRSVRVLTRRSVV